VTPAAPAVPAAPAESPARAASTAPPSSAPSPRARATSALLAVALAIALASAGLTGSIGRPTAAQSVIVRLEAGASAVAVERAITAAGGRITARLGVINGLAASLPATSAARLAGLPGVASVTPNTALSLLSTSGSYPEVTAAGSLVNIAWQIGAPRYWAYGFTGKGVDVAVIDSGVSPVTGLAQADKIVNGPDLSFERKADNLRHLDTYGHGTHVAGIIAGRDPEVTRERLLLDTNRFAGIAPSARIVSVKVANALGATDVSQVIAGIDWVVRNRQQDGLDIRVLNLSFGTDGSQDYLVDPLAFAVERAWHAGIVVVVAAGNSGGDHGRLNNPAFSPYVIAVGASNTRGTIDIRDDKVTDFSSRGDGRRDPDLVAPGKQVVALRVPNAHLDQLHPDARVGDRFFRGDGTSQAAAVVSGAAALVVQQRPNATPDQVKRLLTATTRSIPDTSASAQGSGLLNLWSAYEAPTASQATQSWPRSSGDGSLDAARGSIRIVGADGQVVSGEASVLDEDSGASSLFDVCTAPGVVFDGNSWSATGLDGNSWSSNLDGNSWSITGTSGNSWSGSSWSSSAWTDGNSWSGNGWLGVSWGKKRNVKLP